MQVHAMENDALFVDEGDLDAARALVDLVPEASLCLYPGDRHPFADSSLEAYGEKSTGLMIALVLRFLDDARV